MAHKIIKRGENEAKTVKIDGKRVSNMNCEKIGAVANIFNYIELAFWKHWNLAQIQWIVV